MAREGTRPGQGVFLGQQPLHASGPSGRSNDRPWRALGWFGGLLAFVGLVDVALVWYPLSPGNQAWQFATVGQSFSSLPLLTMGLAGLFASAFAVGGPWKLRLLGGAVFLLGVALLASFALYLLTLPAVLQMAPPEVTTGIHKSIVKTAVMALAFPTTYMVVSVVSFKHSLRIRK